MEPVIMLHQIGLCNYARSVELYLMLIYIVVIQSVIVWKIFCIGSGKPGKLREFHIANFVSTLSIKSGKQVSYAVRHIGECPVRTVC
jgi:hypothetical protein